MSAALEHVTGGTRYFTSRSTFHAYTRLPFRLALSLLEAANKSKLSTKKNRAIRPGFIVITPRFAYRAATGVLAPSAAGAPAADSIHPPPSTRYKVT